MKTARAEEMVEQFANGYLSLRGDTQPVLQGDTLSYGKEWVTIEEKGIGLNYRGWESCDVEVLNRHRVEKLIVLLTAALQEHRRQYGPSQPVRISNLEYVVMLLKASEAENPREFLEPFEEEEVCYKIPVIWANPKMDLGELLYDDACRTWGFRLRGIKTTVIHDNHSVSQALREMFALLARRRAANL